MFTYFYIALIEMMYVTRIDVLLNLPTIDQFRNKKGIVLLNFDR